MMILDKHDPSMKIQKFEDMAVVPEADSSSNELTKGDVILEIDGECVTVPTFANEKIANRILENDRVILFVERAVSEEAKKWTDSALKSAQSLNFDFQKSKRGPVPPIPSSSVAISNTKKPSNSLSVVKKQLVGQKVGHQNGSKKKATGQTSEPLILSQDSSMASSSNSSTFSSESQHTQENIFNSRSAVIESTVETGTSEDSASQDLNCLFSPLENELPLVKILLRRGNQVTRKYRQYSNRWCLEQHYQHTIRKWCDSEIKNERSQADSIACEVYHDLSSDVFQRFDNNYETDYGMFMQELVMESSESTIATSEGATLEIKIPSEVSKKIRLDINVDRTIVSVSSSGSFDKLMRGDVIKRVNDEECTTIRDYLRCIQKKTPIRKFFNLISGRVNEAQSIPFPPLLKLFPTTRKHSVSAARKELTGPKMSSLDRKVESSNRTLNALYRLMADRNSLTISPSPPALISRPVSPANCLSPRDQLSPTSISSQRSGSPSYTLDPNGLH
ncbi:hypothetical protein GCK72_005811 [Caenorhabditis remanei]|uniref:PDZ domain-containing protein n=2 Tax=Caenorhabditis remanei TaxID=31234 RepID=A0A6A5HDM2_CAERE|nr:hypothetical protein GCK72_005811 [Caenorhabditis remanei]KAF1765858.1 hypothetical protein GCK72_005811 [Caenorhabditis remanei]